MYFRIEEYRRVVINHDPVFGILQKLGDPASTLRIACLEGDPEVGKTHILRWIERNSVGVPSQLFCYPDNRTIGEFLLDLASFLHRIGVPTATFDSRGWKTTSQAGVSDVSTRFTKNAVINAINVATTDPNANPEQRLFSANVMFEALIEDLESYNKSQAIPAFFILLDQFDRWDAELSRFVVSRALPRLIKHTSALMVIAGNSCKLVQELLFDPKDRDRVETVRLLRFRRASDIVNYIRMNDGGSFADHDVASWAERTIEECDGRPMEIATRIASLLNLRRQD